MQVKGRFLPEAPEAARNVVQGSGEMADLVRRMDWSRTPLGPIAKWSETLVAAVNLMLLSPFAGAVYWSSDLILLYNDHYRPFLAQKHPWALGCTGPEVWAEAWEQIGDPIRSAFHPGKSVSARAEKIPILVDGVMQDRWWTYGLNPIFESGNIVGIANPVVDDTAAVIAERELRRSREEFEMGMEAASLGMWHYNPETRQVIADDRMHRIVGSPKPNGEVAYWLNLLHPEDQERVAEHFRGVLAGKHDYDIEYRILRDGEVRWLRSKGKASQAADSPQELFAIVEDVTERKLAETALRQNEKLAAVGRLAASIAHEINNPLESVTNLLYLIQNSDSMEDVRTYVTTAERELRRVSLIANQTLRFHKQQTRPAMAFCYDLIGDSLAMFQGRVVNNGVTLEKRKRAEHPVECLGGEIRQVLNNLIGNALDAMPKGGRLLLRSREQVDPVTGERGLVMTVADTGTGMSPQVKERIFDAFYTTKGMGGTGLGLWISSEIVARHRGKLRFRSSDRPGKSGTVFTLFLPFGTCSATSGQR
ncbi:sensor histidine kinase [Terriglobus aquaticus]|uniref:sensor histidine kinase n=1 Tax=Terriglobus aquaticus TaxID=940139 RepID=UPI0021DF6869|nr:ATP-binding protein [Terriglobus aquaticus]